ncbi:MAG: hypothetical protein ABIG46_08975 [Candidatus Omnitrophota bacterium]|nr:hypothetical protein [Candidatus Omnitrophota bacterium]
MRLAISSLAALCLLGLSLNPAQAGWWGKKSDKTDSVEVKAAAPVVKTDSAKPKEASKEEKARLEALSAKRSAVEQKKKELNNTEWQIELVMTNAPAKPKKDTDSVIFKDNQVSISGYMPKGFPPTNYTLTISGDGTLVWETMQTSEKVGVAFWRGEISPNMQIMRGILSYHVDDKTVRDYSFVSVAKKDITQAQAAPVPAPSPAASSSGKKK